MNNQSRNELLSSNARLSVLRSVPEFEELKVILKDKLELFVKDCLSGSLTMDELNFQRGYIKGMEELILRVENSSEWLKDDIAKYGEPV